jgi:protocatechuate 3,4-dioxygenase beta subunit
MGDTHDDLGGLARDLAALAAMRDRRQALRLLAGASLVPWLACDSGDAMDAVSNPDGAIPGQDGGGAAACATIPDETGGPYPGDGSNGANALALSGIVRADLRSSLSPASGIADGVPLTVKLTLVNSKAACAPLAGYAVYLWHCDREGNYSMYTLPSQNYLRGVQVTDAGGTVSFTSIFPGCYAGRWPHIHFEIFPSVAQAIASGTKAKTSQLALPADACQQVYVTAGYAQSITNLAQISLATDNVFSDGATLETATVTGDVTSGFVAALSVGVPV